MKVGIIGLGDIAQKAYLPVITLLPQVEPILCTRNEAKRKLLAEQYRLSDGVGTLDELLSLNIDAAFVHAATEVHPKYVEKLLKNGIPVYVDKPMARSFEEAVQLVDCAEATSKLLFTGFNRRFAPMYRRLRENGKPDIVLMQKNRSYEPGDPRDFIFDDFIHVIDTLRFLMKCPIKDWTANWKLKDGKLHHVLLKLNGEGCTGIGIMNRELGHTEELVEYMTEGKKIIVDNLVTTKYFDNGAEHIERFKDWDTTLFKRGFPQIVQHFLDCVENKHQPEPAMKDSLETHWICEQLVMQITESEK